MIYDTFKESHYKGLKLQNKINKASSSCPQRYKFQAYIMKNSNSRSIDKTTSSELTAGIASGELMIQEPRHEISNNVVYATSKASDQPVYTCSQIRVFATRLIIL